MISVKLPNPRFSSQTKDKLVNNEIEGVTSKATYDGLMHFFDTNPSVAKKVIDKGLTAARAREAARKARETVRKSAMTGGGCPASWPTVPIATRPTPSCTLWRVIPRGLSQQGRDRKFQAILPIRGKLINVRRPAQQGAREQGNPHHDHCSGTGIGDGEGEGALTWRSCVTTKSLS